VVPVVTGFCSLPLTKPLVRLTVPFAISVFDPVATAPDVSVSAPPTVTLLLAPEKLTPFELLTVRPEKVGPAQVIDSAIDPFSVAVPPLAVNAPLLEMMPLIVWLAPGAYVVPEPTVSVPPIVAAELSVFVPPTDVLRLLNVIAFVPLIV